jgi:hypothetical protein
VILLGTARVWSLVTSTTFASLWQSHEAAAFPMGFCSAQARAAARFFRVVFMELGRDHCFEILSAT